MNVLSKPWVAIVATLVILSGCTDSGGVSTRNPNESVGASCNSVRDVNSEVFDCTAMLANIVDSIIIKNHTDFVLQGNAAKTSMGNYCSAIGTGEAGVNKAAAQADWLILMSTWQRVELHLLGPTSKNTSLRSRIHSYGETSGLSRCLVDRNVERARFDDFNISIWSYPARGLEAVEYLLYTDSLAHSCTSENTQTTNWNLLGDADKEQSRCLYSQQVLNDIVDAGTEMQNMWLVSGDNYRAEFLATEALQELSDSIFYLETGTKDIKLGITLGLKTVGLGKNFCADDACPQRVESPFSRSSLQNIRSNILSFWEIYKGGDGLGFDDLIQFKGMDIVNEAFAEDVFAALALVDTMIEAGPSLNDQSNALLTQEGAVAACINGQASPDDESTWSACRLHGLVKRISDRLRTDFIAVVNVTLPTAVIGDAD